MMTVVLQSMCVLCRSIFLFSLRFLYDLLSVFLFFFFFQAEDGIRDHCVTGVQTCALPISRSARGQARRPALRRGLKMRRFSFCLFTFLICVGIAFGQTGTSSLVGTVSDPEIGRASCRKECRSRWSPYH